MPGSPRKPAFHGILSKRAGWLSAGMNSTAANLRHTWSFGRELSPFPMTQAQVEVCNIGHFAFRGVAETYSVVMVSHAGWKCFELAWAVSLHLDRAWLVDLDSS